MAKKLGVLVILIAGVWGLASMQESTPKIEAAPPAPPPRLSAEACASVAPRDYAALPKTRSRTPTSRLGQASVLVSVSVSVSVSVREFDILGIRLGMNKSDVLLALRCTDATEVPATVRLTPCAADTITVERQRKASRDSFRNGQRGWLPPEPSKSCTDSIYVNDGDGLSILVDLAEDLPAQPGRSVVTRVTLFQGGRKNSASSKAFTDALARKYGPQLSMGSENGTLGGESYGSPKLSTVGYLSTFRVELDDSNERKRLDEARFQAVSDARPVATPRL